MKVSALIVAGALALTGTAFAQQYDSSKAESGKPPPTVKSKAEPKEGVGTKLKKAMRRIGDKTRQAMHGGDSNTRQAQSGHDTDTRTMGGPAAPGSSDADRGRRSRMDDAYANWRARQKQ